LKAKGEPDEAAKLLEQVLQHKEKVQQDWDLPATQVALASCYRELSKVTEAESLLEKALSSLQHKHGSSHLALCPALNALGLLCKHKRDLPKAERFLSQALRIRLEWSTDDHPETLAVRHNLGEVLIASGRVEEGRSLLKENLRLMEARKNKQ